MTQEAMTAPSEPVAPHMLPWRAWIAHFKGSRASCRVFLPAAVGSQAALAWRGSPGRGAWWVAAFCFFLAALASCQVMRQGRRPQCPLLLGSLLASSGAAIAGPSGVGRLLAMVSILGGAVALLWHSRQDWLGGRAAGWSYELATMPWFSALVLGLSGGWLLSRASLRAPIGLGEQRVVALGIGTMLLEQVVFLRWRAGIARPGNRGRLPFRDVPHALAYLLQVRAWGGYVLPATLMTLTLIGFGAHWSILAILFFLLGEALWYGLVEVR